MAGPHTPPHTHVTAVINYMYTRPGQVEVKVQSAERRHTNNTLLSCPDVDAKALITALAAPTGGHLRTSKRARSPFIQFVLHGFALPVAGDDLDFVDLHQVGHLSELHIVQDKRPHVVTEPVGVERTLQDRRTDTQRENPTKIWRVYP